MLLVFLMHLIIIQPSFISSVLMLFLCVGKVAAAVCFELEKRYSYISRHLIALQTGCCIMWFTFDVKKAKIKKKTVFSAFAGKLIISGY